MTKIEFIQIEPTTRCNFKCAFCPRNHLEHGDLDYNVFLQILEEYSDVRYLQLYGEGEPLLYPKFFSMIKEAAKKQIKISTITNGSLLYKNIENVLESGLYSVHVSLESTHPETFHKLRGGNLEQIFKGINMLIEMRNKNNHVTPFVGFSVTVLKETIDDLDQIFKNYQSLSMDGGIIVQPLNEMSSYADNYNEEVNVQALEKTDLMNIDYELDNNRRLMEIRRNNRLDATYFEALRQNFNPAQDGCPWLLRSLFVNFQGYAMPCSMIKNKQLYSFGQVGNDSMDSVLEKREKMRDRILSGDIPEACKNCRTLDPNYRPGKMYQYLGHPDKLNE